MYFPWREYYELRRSEDTESEESVRQEAAPGKNPFLARLETWRRKRTAPTLNVPLNQTSSDLALLNDPPAARR